MSDSAYAFRFRMYAKSKGMTPAEVLESDAKEFPGRKMAGYLTWISDARSKWMADTNRRAPCFLSIHDLQAFDRWLESRP